MEYKIASFAGDSFNNYPDNRCDYTIRSEDAPIKLFCAKKRDA